MQFAFGRQASFTPHVLTIGNFDGVHLGHQRVIAQAKHAADGLDLPLTVLIFEPQPREYFASQSKQTAPARLQTLKAKVAALAELSIDRVWCLKFADIRMMTAEAFVDQLLIQKSVRHLVVGDDFRFGCDRLGDFAFLEARACASGFGLEHSQTHMYEGARISSSRIRKALEAHDFDLAQSLLGRPFSVTGKVAYGQQLGRQLGFPTANIRLIRRPPLTGVFGCTVILPDGHQTGAIANIGTRPTVSGDGVWLEVHLHDFDGQLYGQQLTVIPRFFIRPEMKFESIERLSAQIAEDNAHARQLLNAMGTTAT